MNEELKFLRKFKKKIGGGHFKKKWHQSVTLRVKNQLNYMPLTFMLFFSTYISVSLK